MTSSSSELNTVKIPAGKSTTEGIPTLSLSLPSSNFGTEGTMCFKPLHSDEQDSCRDDSFATRNTIPAGITWCIAPTIDMQTPVRQIWIGRRVRNPRVIPRI